MPKSRKETNEKLNRYWKSNIERWAASGLTQTEYCRRNDLSKDRFTYRKRKFKRQNLPVEFIQLPMSANIHRTGLKLNLGQGVQIEIPDGFTSETLERVLATLKSIS
jgi:hypothetical protein